MSNFEQLLYFKALLFFFLFKRNCACGGTFKEHKSRAVLESALPGTVDRRKVVAVNEGPRIKSYPTNAYGKIEFQMDGLGLLKPAKVRF